MTESKFCHSESSRRLPKVDHQHAPSERLQDRLSFALCGEITIIESIFELASIDSGTGMMVAWKQRQLNYEWTRYQMTKDQEQIQQQGIQN